MIDSGIFICEMFMLNRHCSESLSDIESLMGCTMKGYGRKSDTVGEIGKYNFSGYEQQLSIRFVTFRFENVLRCAKCDTLSGSNSVAL